MSDHNAEMSDKSILLSGASGLIGSYLVRSWTAKPIHVVQLIRKKNPFPAPNPRKTSLFWNLDAAEPIANLAPLTGLDAAVHLSGANVAAHRWTLKYRQEIVSSRVNSTGALAKTLAGLHPRPRVFVCASAIGIYGDRADEFLTETSPPGSGFLADTCVAWEAATRAAEDAGIRVVHMRFGVVFAPNGGALAKLLPLFRLGLGGRLGNGREWMPWITLRDAVGAIQHCIDDDSIRGAVNVVAPHPVTNAEFTKALGAAVRRPAVLPVPAFALRLAMGGQMADEALLASARVLPTKLEQTAYRFADPEIGPALRIVVASG